MASEAMEQAGVLAWYLEVNEMTSNCFGGRCLECFFVISLGVVNF